MIMAPLAKGLFSTGGPVSKTLGRFGGDSAISHVARAFCSILQYLENARAGVRRSVIQEGALCE